MRDRDADRIRCPRQDCRCANTRVLWKYYRARDAAIVRKHRCTACGMKFTTDQRVSKAA